MIIEKLPRFLCGWLEAEVKSNNVNEFLNLCLKNYITVYDVEFTDDGAIFSISVSDYKKLQKIKEAPSKRRIIKKHGLRFFTHKYRKRAGFVLGTFFMVFMLIFLSGFVWDIDVAGNERLSDSLILETLEENGVYIGAHKSKINIRRIEDNVIDELYDLAWITINLDGSFAHIEVKERDVKPITEDKSKPSNLVASEGGQIVKMEIVKGKPIATVGSGIQKGELLVAGFYNDKKDNLILEHSSGKVFARVEASKSFEISKTTEKIIGTEKKVYYSLKIANNSVNLFIDKYPSGSDWKKSIKEKQIGIFGLKFPIFLNETTFEKDVVTKVVLSADEAKQRIKDEIEHFEKSELYECDILEKNIVWKMDASQKYMATVDYVLIKNIAKQQYIESDRQK